MTLLEIACVAIGLVGMLTFALGGSIKIDNWKNGVVIVLIIILRTVPFLLMVLLPLYFRLWKG